MAWFAGLFIVHNFAYTSQESLGAGILGMILTVWILPDGIKPQCLIAGAVRLAPARGCLKFTLTASRFFEWLLVSRSGCWASVLFTSLSANDSKRTSEQSRRFYIAKAVFAKLEIYSIYALNAVEVTVSQLTGVKNMYVNGVVIGKQGL